LSAAVVPLALVDMQHTVVRHVLDFSIDLSGLTDVASSLFNSLQGIVVLIGGIILGFGLIGWVLGMIIKAVRVKS
jgi:hypothetical protein